MKKFLIADDQQGWREHNVLAVSRLYADSDIITAASAKEAYDILLENISEPFDYVLTDMQMESDYEPKKAGEWLIEQIQNLPQYRKTKIIIISAMPMLAYIAERYGVDYIPKSSAAASEDKYKELLN